MSYAAAAQPQNASGNNSSNPTNHPNGFGALPNPSTTIVKTDPATSSETSERDKLKTMSDNTNNDKNAKTQQVTKVSINIEKTTLEKAQIFITLGEYESIEEFINVAIGEKVEESVNKVKAALGRNGSKK